VKLIFGDLNSNPYSSHLTRIYICGVTIASKVRGGRRTWL